jgi:hypothetical protein
VDERIDITLAHFRQAHLDGGPHLFRAETAFRSFLCTLSAIEALAGYRFGAEGVGSGERFRRFVMTYFPPAYHEHAERLWDFRNGMIHAFSPRRMSIIRGVPGAHLTCDASETPVLNAENLFADMQSAADTYVAELRTRADLQTAFLRRLDSADGGGIHVAVVGFGPVGSREDA